MKPPVSVNPPRPKAEYIKTSAAIDVSEWSLETWDNLDDGLAEKVGKLIDDHRHEVRTTFEKTVLSATNDVLRAAIEEYPPEVSFVVEWQSEVGEDQDVLMLEVALPFSNDEYEQPRWAISLRDVITSLIDTSEVVEDTNRLPKQAVRDALLSEIARIDAAIAKEQT